MNLVKTLIVTGYRNYELNIYQESDPKIKVIKKALKLRLTDYAEDGLEWILISGNLGIELWAAQVVFELQKTYADLKVAMIFPYAAFGENWSGKNQEIFNEIKNRADYINETSNHPYQNPAQLKNHSHFLMKHADGALVVYDQEYPGKTEYFYQEINGICRNDDFLFDQISIDDLQNYIYDDNSI